MSTMTPNYCGNCGAPLAAGAGACEYCRAAFASAAPVIALPAGAAPTALDAEIVDRLRAGDKIRAVKLYKERYGVSLLEAKRAIDELDRANRRR